MQSHALAPLLLRSDRPSRLVGVLAAIGGVTLATAAVYPLKQVTPVVSLGVLYVLAVVVVSTFWGLYLGIATSILSAAAFNFFHLPPHGRFALADERDWVALLVFVVVAIATGSIAELARARSRESAQRREEADLAAEMAEMLLGSTDLDTALAHAGERLAAALGVPSAALALGDVSPGGETIAFPLRGDGSRVGTLLLPATLTQAERARTA